MPQQAVPVEVVRGEGYDLASQSFHQKLRQTEQVIVVKLEGLEDPDTDDGHEFGYVIGKTEKGGRPVNVDVALVEGYRSDEDSGREIQMWRHMNVPAGDSPMTQRIAPENARKIRNYDDLYVRLVFRRG